MVKTRYRLSLLCGILILLLGLGVWVSGLYSPIIRSSGEKRAVNQQSNGSAIEGTQRSRTRSSKVNLYGKRALWNSIDNDREKFIANFIPDNRPGHVRAMWMNSTVVQFWIAQLSSPNPRHVELAIKILESAANTPMSEYVDSNREYVHRSAVDEEAFTIQMQMRLVKGMLVDARLKINKALEEADMTDAHKIENHPEFYHNKDDNNFLKDAEPVLRAFVPQIGDGDALQTERTRKVLSMFTFDLFANKSVEWWREELANLESH